MMLKEIDQVQKAFYLGDAIKNKEWDKTKKYLFQGIVLISRQKTKST